ncbi:hypothetical protein EsH8_I_001419 [Colletotrichum jinshuiense]
MAWADAICINQGDDIEKAHQVNLMGVIYDRATEVVVWLGNDPKNLAEEAFEGLSRTNTAIQTGTHIDRSLVPGGALLLSTGDESGGKSSYPISQYSSNLRQVLKSNHLTAVKELYQLPWFTRVWVLQEVGLASEASAFWGDFRIDFSEIAMFILFAMSEEHMDYMLGQDVKDVISGSPYYAFWNVWSTYDKKGSWVNRTHALKSFSESQAAQCKIDFLVVLEASRRFNATNALDHVFAFLGHPKALLPSTKQPLVQADYRLGLADLHTMVANRLAEQSLNFLVQVQHQPNSLDPGCTIPSWIPQWNINNENAPTAFWEAWDASLRASTHPKFTARPSDNGLHVFALIFDAIDIYTDIMKKPDFERSSSGPGNLVENCWKLTEQAAEVKPHVYGDDALLAFALTIICHHQTEDTGPLEYSSLVGLFNRFCAVYNESFWKEKIERFGISFLNTTPLGERGYVAQFQDYATNRRFFVSKGGYWGLGPPILQQGDVCAILFGADVPFILRPTSKHGEYRLVGQAYIKGAMYGELVQQREEARTTYRKEKICIV